MTRILDLGCGPAKIQGAIGVDSNARVDPDVLHDLDVFPYPFSDDEFDRVVSYNSIEHLADPLRVLAEAARITRSGGEILLTTPHFTSPDAYTDPTHRHAFTSRSFDYLVSGTELGALDYEAAVLRRVSITVEFMGYSNLTTRLLRWAANRDLVRYERRWAYLFPAHQIVFVFQVNK